MYDKKKHQTVTFKELKTSKYLAFLPKNDNLIVKIVV